MSDPPGKHSEVSVLLVVESDSAFAHALMGAVEEGGRRCAIATSVSAAHARLAAEPIELIVLDLGLLGGDADTAVATIARFKRCDSNVQVVLSVPEAFNAFDGDLRARTDTDTVMRGKMTIAEIALVVERTIE